MNIFTRTADNLTEKDINQIAKNNGKLTSAQKHEDEKMYVVLFRAKKEDEPEETEFKGLQEDSKDTFDGEFIISKGRRHTFDRIKECISEYDHDYEELDFRNSVVLVEGVDPLSAISLYRFIKYCNGIYPDEEYPLERDNWEENKATGNGNYCGTLLREEE